ncbi:outer membrane beta-barrel protein [Sansalvadorimonas sp. 2012CJ34-2]|uniref:Outer membrane beta-barrel protein n=1 Tax=Parendozoicomonas callyspongiae TaxID=2942213 RepID=A0ABT0PEQ6_9GAMM|nr:outer membrane beta-barrel protein [Sansalvadorimonas sp. 2012CJ34-2]MCL6269867.1 outer membrane beta-barrel protein [Sansalvadorimonas sp. 2012CJ34-2]
MIRKISLLILTLSAGLAFGETPWYMGVAGGAGEVEVVGHDRGPEATKVLSKAGLGVNSAVSAEDDGTAVWKVFAGYRINDYWAVEAGYQDLGNTSGGFSSSISKNGTTSNLSGKVKSEYDALSSSVVGQWKFNRWIGVYGRAGVHYWKHEFTAKGSNTLGMTIDETETDNGIDYLYGGGVVGQLSDNISVRLEWERFHGIEDEEGVDIKTLSTVYRF